MAVFLSIVIVLIGLFGIVSFTIAKRTKEIAIRKILGSSVLELNFLLMKQFVVLILISNIIAIPLSYWVSNVWLQNFTYKIELVSLWWVSPLIA